MVFRFMSFNLDSEKPWRNPTEESLNHQEITTIQMKKQDVWMKRSCGNRQKGGLWLLISVNQGCEWPQCWSMFDFLGEKKIRNYVILERFLYSPQEGSMTQMQWIPVPFHDLQQVLPLQLQLNLLMLNAMETAQLQLFGIPAKKKKKNKLAFEQNYFDIFLQIGDIFVWHGTRNLFSKNQHAHPPWLGGGCSCSPSPFWLTDGLASPLKLWFIFSQITSTSLSKTCFTLMLSLALASKNWKPVEQEKKRDFLKWTNWCNNFECSCRQTSFECSPSSVATLWPSCLGTCLSSSKSNLFPTKTTWALSHEYVLIWVALETQQRLRWLWSLTHLLSHAVYVQ